MTKTANFKKSCQCKGKWLHSQNYIPVCHHHVRQFSLSQGLSPKSQGEIMVISGSGLSLDLYVWECFKNISNLVPKIKYLLIS